MKLSTSLEPTDAKTKENATVKEPAPELAGAKVRAVVMAQITIVTLTRPPTSLVNTDARIMETVAGIEVVPSLDGAKASVDVNPRRFQQFSLELVIVPTMRSSTNSASTDVRLRKTAKERENAQLPAGVWEKMDAPLKSSSSPRLEIATTTNSKTQWVKTSAPTTKIALERDPAQLTDGARDKVAALNNESARNLCFELLSKCMYI